MVQSLKRNYENACNAYLEQWCKKHEFDYKEAEWVGGEVGGVVCVADYYVSLTDIMTDIEKDAPRGEYWKYYDYSLRCAWLEVYHPNYDNWLRGAPIKSEEELNKLEELKRNIQRAEELFRNAQREW